MSRLKPREAWSVVLVFNQFQLQPGTLLLPLQRSVLSARGDKPISPRATERLEYE